MRGRTHPTDEVPFNLRNRVFGQVGQVLVDLGRLRPFSIVPRLTYRRRPSARYSF